MTPTAPEFSRPLRLDQIGQGEHEVTVSATPDERTALARRFELAALDRLEATYRVRSDAAGIVASGHLSATATQVCVATGEDVPARIEEDFDLRFLPEDEPEGDEIELDPEACDTMFYTGSAIDLGEAAAETLLLALDPYPRAPGADAVLREAGVIREEDARPVSAFAALKDQMGKA